MKKLKLLLTIFIPVLLLNAKVVKLNQKQFKIQKIAPPYDGYKIEFSFNDVLVASYFSGSEVYRVPSIEIGNVIRTVRLTMDKLPKPLSSDPIQNTFSGVCDDHFSACQFTIPDTITNMHIIQEFLYLTGGSSGPMSSIFDNSRFIRSYDNLYLNDSVSNKVFINKPKVYVDLRIYASTEIITSKGYKCLSGIFPSRQTSYVGSYYGFKTTIDNQTYYGYIDVYNYNLYIEDVPGKAIRVGDLETITEDVDNKIETSNSIVYPNPSKGQVFINDDDILTGYIKNMNGQVLIQLSNNTNKFNLEKGLYIVEWTNTQNQYFNQKLVVE
ncbi:MAG: T9SS type A sorting domain-containing protein [Cytophagales bacterium]